MESLLLFLFVGGGALFLGLAVGAAVGSSTIRIVGLVLFGALVLVALLAAVIFTAPTEPQTSDECWECSEIFGHWTQPVVLLFLALWNLVAWAFGLLLGAGVRAFVARRRQPAV